MTNTGQLSIDVLCAPLAAIDRRGLSQAWYSALHLAHDAPPASGSAGRPAAAKAPAVSAESRVAAESPRRSNATDTMRSHAARHSGARVALAFERRSPRLPLARRIERTFLDPRTRTPLATFSLGAGAARVVVTMHGTGDCVRLIAVCAPAARRAVVSALEQARYALAARGIALRAVLSAEPSCS